MNTDQLIRANIRNLQGYTSARDEYCNGKGIMLDANENPAGNYNRYPDPYQKALKQRIAELKSMPAEYLFLGNGSDEVVDLAFRIFCEPRENMALTFIPTYGMYTVSATINNVELVQVPLNDNFDIDIDTIIPYLREPALKMILLCSPNNPTGNLLNKEAIAYILKNFNGIVIIDEAYIDFANSTSWSKKIEDYPNLIVIQTLSKAYGMAGLRIGLAWMHPLLISYFNKVKPPYNISAINQQAAINILNDAVLIKKNIDEILVEKRRLINEIQSLAIVKKVFPSDANFILVETEYAKFLYQYLKKKKIIVRNRHEAVANTLRITIGSTKENQQLIIALKSFSHE